MNDLYIGQVRRYEPSMEPPYIIKITHFDDVLVRYVYLDDPSFGELTMYTETVLTKSKPIVKSHNFKSLYDKLSST